MHVADGAIPPGVGGPMLKLLADVAADDGLEIKGGLPILFDLAGRSEVDVDVPARRRGGLIDILDDRGRLGRASRRGHQIVEWVLDRPLRVARAEVDMDRVGARGAEAAGSTSAQEIGVYPREPGSPSCAAGARWMFSSVPAARPSGAGCELVTVVSIAPTSLAVTSGNGTRTSP